LSLAKTGPLDRSTVTKNQQKNSNKKMIKII